MFVQVVGTYREKTRVFGITIFSKKGSFSFTVPVPDPNASVSYAEGPFVFGVHASGGTIALTATEFGVLSQTIGKASLKTRDPQKFKFELDSRNEIEGTILITNAITAGVVSDGRTVAVAHDGITGSASSAKYMG